jgi:hypothetical protein
MSKRTSTVVPTAPLKKPPRARTPRRLQVTHPRVAGVDVHLDIHWVAVPAGDAPPAPPGHPPHLPANVRSFGACTADLHRLAEWLAKCGVKTVAMESTGVYWNGYPLAAPRAVCTAAEWAPLDRNRPGVYALDRAGIPTGPETDRFARGSAGADEPRRIRLSPFARRPEDADELAGTPKPDAGWLGFRCRG